MTRFTKVAKVVRDRNYPTGLATKNPRYSKTQNRGVTYSDGVIVAQGDSAATEALTKKGYDVVRHHVGGDGTYSVVTKHGAAKITAKQHQFSMNKYK